MIINMDKHAYMIMAHHRPDLLQNLIDALDDSRNDIIIHIDKKCKMKPENFYCKNAKMIFVNQMDVNWGGYTQIECEYRLMQAALGLGEHAYYHLLTGANYPLWNQDYIHAFFAKNKGKEFIGFDYDSDYSLRVKYYIPFSEHGKLRGITGKLILILRYMAKKAQDLIKVDYREGTDLEIKKGCAYFSITQGLVEKILQDEDKIEKLLKHTICCDEVFVQTIAYNSEFRKNIYDMVDEFDGCMRELAWPSNLGAYRPGWNFCMEDLDYLLKSKRLFAMKFEAEDGLLLINAIKEVRNIS